MWGIMRQHRLDRFDIGVAGAILTLLTTIGVAVVRGDQVGITVRAVSPQGSVSSRSAVQMTFDEAVDQASLEAYFSISPPARGSFSVANEQATFRPSDPLMPAQIYHVSVRSGMPARSGRRLKHDVSWQLTVRTPRVVYLGPLTQSTQNLYIADPSAPGTAPQSITDSKNDVMNYAVAPDGGQIVYSELLDDGTDPLFLWDAATHTSMLLYDCKDASCDNMIWRPDGTAFAFEHSAFNTGKGDTPGAARVWLFDMTSKTARPLLGDDQVLTSEPRWLGDGMRLAMLSTADEGILIYNFATKQSTLFPIDTAQYDPNTMAEFSADGRFFYLQEDVTLADGRGATHLTLFDLSTTPPTSRDVEPPDEAVNDMDVAWGLDSNTLFVARAPLEMKGSLAAPISKLDLISGKATLLVNDDGYNQDNMQLSPTGDTLLFERTHISFSVPDSSIWVSELSTGKLQLIAEDAWQAA